MTPDALVSAFALADRFALMLRALTGQPLPELPLMPGRRIVAPPAPTPEQDAQQRDAEQQAAQVWRALADDCEGATHD